MPSRSLWVDQRAANTGCMKYVARPATWQISYVMNNVIWPYSTRSPVSVLHVEGKSQLEGLQHDMRALELDIKMHLIRSRSTGDPCKCRSAWSRWLGTTAEPWSTRPGILVSRGTWFHHSSCSKIQKLHAKIQSLLHQLLQRKMLVAQGEACRLEWQVITAVFPCQSQQLYFVLQRWEWCWSRNCWLDVAEGRAFLRRYEFGRISEWSSGKIQNCLFQENPKRMMGDMSSVLEEVFYYLPVYSVC